MSEVLKVVSYSFGTILGLILIGIIVFWFIRDVTQKRHSILRNYPVIRHLRFLFEKQGEYFRQYFFSGDRDEMSFNRATRTWVYKNAKNEGGIAGFGSTNDLREPGSIISSMSLFRYWSVNGCRRRRLQSGMPIASILFMLNP